MDCAGGDVGAKNALMEKKTFLTIAADEYDKWFESQAGQTDAFEYERSFAELMDRIAKILLQGSVGELPADHRKKKRL